MAKIRVEDMDIWDEETKQIRAKSVKRVQNKHRREDLGNKAKVWYSEAKSRKKRK